MSKPRRRRGRCQACGEPCQSIPLELQVYKTDGEVGWWEWRLRLLCPPCRVLLDELLNSE